MTEAKPTRSYLLAIAIISASALAYEVLLMRLFSIIQWHHFAYMIISLALLGYGVSGVFLALNRDALQRRFPAAITANMLLFSFSVSCLLRPGSDDSLQSRRDSVGADTIVLFTFTVPAAGIAVLFCG